MSLLKRAKSIPRSLEYNPVLDGVRGFAIALVVLFHFFPQRFGFGYVGVDLFFLLSGYLITNVILKKLGSGRFSLLEFYRNRARRLFPALELLLATALAVGFLFFLADEYLSLGLHVNSSAWYFENFRLLHEVGYWDKAALSKPLLHIWSLSIEEQFYLVWPAALLLILFLSKHRRLKNFLVAAALAGFLAASVYLAQEDSQTAFYNTLARAWEPLLGASLAIFLGEWVGKLPGLVSPLAFAGLLYYAPTHLNIGYYDPLKIAIFLALASLWFIPAAKNGNRLLESPPMVWLGLTSYSLYLWHYFLISLLFIFGYNELRIWALPASLLLSWLTFVYIEVPSRKQQSYLFAAGLAILLAATGALGYGVYLAKGLPGRPVVKSYLNQNDQLHREAKTNEECQRLVEFLLGEPPQFLYCKSTTDDPQKISYAVIGDSHAEALFNGLSEWLSSQGFDGILLAGSGKPAYVGSYRGRNKKDVESAKIKVGQIYRVLDKLPNLRGIVLTTRMAMYVTDRGYGETEARFTKNPTHYEEYFLGIKNYDPNTIFMTHLQETLAYFKGKSLPVILVLENPELGFPPNNCVQRWFLPPPQHCIISKNKVDARLGWIKEEVRNAAKRFDNVTIFDLEDYFCDSGRCYVVRRGTMLYADDDHMSLGASREIAKELGHKVLSLLQQNR